MFGPNDSSGKFVFEMQKNMEANIESIDLTECDQLRDFIYIDDVVSAFEIVLEKRYEIKEFYKNFHPITKYFHPISKPQVQTTKKTPHHLTPNTNNTKTTPKKKQIKIVKNMSEKYC